MREVLEQTRLLGEAILNSDIYKKVQTLESQVTEDPQAAAAVSNYVSRQQLVQNLLADSDHMDADALAAAGRELDDAEQAMDAVPMIVELRSARKAYSDMMNNVNQLLSLMLTGGSESKCTGNCSSCGGCH